MMKILDIFKREVKENVVLLKKESLEHVLIRGCLQKCFLIDKIIRIVIK
jgi:hypothetical protein